MIVVMNNYKVEKMKKILMMMMALPLGAFGTEEEGEKKTSTSATISDVADELTPSQRNDLTTMRILCEKSIAVGLVKRDEAPTASEETTTESAKKPNKKKSPDDRAQKALEILKSLLNEDVTKEGGSKGKTKGQVMEEKLRKLIEGKTPADIATSFISTLSAGSAAPQASASTEEGAAATKTPPAETALPEFKKSYHGKWKNSSKDKGAGQNMDFAGKMAVYASCISMATAKRACAKTQNEPCGTAINRAATAMGLGGVAAAMGMAAKSKNKDKVKSKGKSMLSGLGFGSKKKKKQ